MDLRTQDTREETQRQSSNSSIYAPVPGEDEGFYGTHKPAGHQISEKLDNGLTHKPAGHRISEKLENGLKLNGALRQQLAKEKIDRSEELHFVEPYLRFCFDLETLLKQAQAKIKRRSLMVQPLANSQGIYPDQLTPLEFYIQQRGYTTSSGEQLPHILARDKSTSLTEIELERELVYSRKLYEDELEYHQQISCIENAFKHNISEAEDSIRASVHGLKRLLEDRDAARYSAACEWLRKIGIDADGENLEQTFF